MIVYSLLVFLALLGVLLFFVKPLKLFKIHIVGREPYLIARATHEKQTPQHSITKDSRVIVVLVARDM